MWHRVTEHRMHQCLLFKLEVDRETTSFVLRYHIVIIVIIIIITSFNAYWCADLHIA